MNILEPSHCVVAEIHKKHIWFSAVEAEDRPGHQKMVAWHCAGTWTAPEEEQQ